MSQLKEAPVQERATGSIECYVRAFAPVIELVYAGRHVTVSVSYALKALEAYEHLRSILPAVEAWLDGVRNERDRTRFEQRWNTLQDEAAELRVLVLRALQ